MNDEKRIDSGSVCEIALAYSTTSWSIPSLLTGRWAQFWLSTWHIGRSPFLSFPIDKTFLLLKKKKKKKKGTENEPFSCQSRLLSLMLSDVSLMWRSSHANNRLQSHSNGETGCCLSQGKWYGGCAYAISSYAEFWLYYQDAQVIIWRLFTWFVAYFCELLTICVCCQGNGLGKRRIRFICAGHKQKRDVSKQRFDKNKSTCNKFSRHKLHRIMKTGWWKFLLIL